MYIALDLFFARPAQQESNNKIRNQDDAACTSIY